MNTAPTKTLPHNRTRRPFLKAFACGAFAYSSLFVFLGSPGSSEVAGYFLGITMMPAAITGMLAYRSKSVWTLWEIIGMYTIALIWVGWISRH